MATRLQIRRGTGLPTTDLREGELAYSTSTNKLYVGTGIYDTSTSHYKVINSIENLSDLGLIADAQDLNILYNANITPNELDKLSGLNTTTAELNLLHSGNYPPNQSLTTSDFLNLMNLSATLANYSPTNHSHDLEDLDNVSGIPQPNQVLKWNGTSWAPAADNASSLTSLGITTTAEKINYTANVTSDIQAQLDDKFDLTATGQVITENITIGPIGSPGANADSRSIIFQSTTTLDQSNPIQKSLALSNTGRLQFDGSDILTGAVILDSYLRYDAAQTLDTAEKLQVLNNLGITATTDELNYVDGVTSNIQTQLNAKANLVSPAFTGTPTLSTNITAQSSGTQLVNKNYVDGEISNALVGSGSYTETLKTTLEDSDTYALSNITQGAKKLFVTLFPNPGVLNQPYTVQSHSQMIDLDYELAYDTKTHPTNGVCFNDQGQIDSNLTSQQACETEENVGYEWVPQVYVSKSKVVFPIGGQLQRLNSTHLQFTEPSSVSEHTWQLKVSEVTY